MLEEEDASFLLNYTSLMEDASSSVDYPMSGSTNSLFRRPSGLLVVISVAAVAYAVPHLADPTMWEDSPESVWIGGGVLALVGLLGVLPMVGCLYAWRCLRRQCEAVRQDVSDLLEEATSVSSICRKAIRLVQEMELVNRGFTL